MKRARRKIGEISYEKKLFMNRGTHSTPVLRARSYPRRSWIATQATHFSMGVKGLHTYLEGKLPAEKYTVTLAEIADMAFRAGLACTIHARMGWHSS